MRKLILALSALAIMGFVTPPSAFAQISLQESVVVTGGTLFLNTFAIPGINAASFNTATGTGTLTFTITGSGAHSFDILFDHELSVPFFNEYGATSAAGPASGQTWQIDDPTFGTIATNTLNNALDDTNHVHGTTDNTGGSCASVYDPGCSSSNDDTSMAMGFNFNLAAGQKEIITLDLSTTAPRSGFYMEQIHPVDPNNPNETDLFFSGSAATQSGGTTPEPSSLLLVLGGGAPLGLVFKALRHKLSKAS